MTDISDDEFDRMASGAHHQTVVEDWEPPPQAAPPTRAAQPAAQPQLTVAERFFYDGKRYLLDVGTDFVPMDRTSCKAHLKAAFAEDPEAAICEIQTARFVTYAGPIAGHQRGLHFSQGKRLLATSSPSLPAAFNGAARRSDFPTIHAFLKALFNDDVHGTTQLAIFIGWLKIARAAVLSGKHRPGQALCLAGDVGTGKSRLIKDVIAPCLGNRIGLPFQYLSGQTPFNSDLLAAC